MEVAGVAPLPKFHSHVTPVTVPVLVKSTFAPVQPGAVELKLAVGVWLMVMVCVMAWGQVPLLVTVSVMVFVPAVAYITFGGFCADESAGVAPVPKSQLYVQFVPVVPV